MADFINSSPTSAKSGATRQESPQPGCSENKAFAIGLIGSGNAAEAIIASLLAGGWCAAEQILVSDPNVARLKQIADMTGIRTTTRNEQVAWESDIVVLAVKPQQFGIVADEMADSLPADPLILSIMAGVSIGEIEARFTSSHPRVIRVMPNLALSVREGMTAICGGKLVTAKDMIRTQRLFETGGKVLTVYEESMIDAVTALSGSGPAYVCYFLECLIEAGLGIGLSRETSALLANQTLLGTTKLLQESGCSPQTLRERVASKGGVTEAALDGLQEQGVKKRICEAIATAWRGSAVLGRGKHE